MNLFFKRLFCQTGRGVSVAVFRNLQQRSARSLCRREQNAGVIHDHGLGTVHIHLRRKRKLPQQFAVFDRDSDCAFPADPHDLSAAGKRSQNGRGVSRAIAERTPNSGAGEPVLRYDAFAIRAPRRDNHFLVDDQR